MSERKTVRTMCPMSCHPTLCGMLVEVENDRLAAIKGDPDNPDSRGFLCVRGRASSEIIDNPQRLLYPLLRERRGADDWRRISWAQALDLMAERVQAQPPHATALWSGHGESTNNYGTRVGGSILRRFAHLYGCQWWHPAMICWGAGGFGLGLTGLLAVNTKEDLGENAELIVLWGANLASQPNTAPHLKAAKRRGARIIVIDVRDTEAAAQADQVLRIVPGSDAALALALMHVIIGENRYAADFVANHTVGLAALTEHVREFSPAWAARRTGIDAADIVALARDYAATTPAMIVLGGSSMHKGVNAWQSARAIACLPALTGNVGIPGGGLGPRHGGASFGQGLASLVPEADRSAEHFVPNQMAAMTAAIAAGKIKNLFLLGTNMVSSFADANALAAGLERTDFIVSYDLFDNETIRQHADLVLPATAWLEQLGCKMTNTHAYLMEPALPAPGATRTLSEILRALAARLGLDDCFPWADDEAMYDAALAHPATGHATVAAMRAEGGIRALQISHVAYPDLRFDTPSGKLELFSERAATLGLPGLPSFTEPTPGSYPLAFRQGRTLTHFHAFYDHGRALPSLARLDAGPRLWLAPADAEQRGIADGAPIRIYNERGEFNATAQVTRKIPPGTVWMRDGWAGINRLTAGEACLPDAAVDWFGFSAGQAAFDAAVDVELVS